MLSHSDLYTGSVEAIDVVWSSEFRTRPACVKTVFVRFGKQAHFYTARQRSQQRIANTWFGEAIHRHIDLACFLIDQCNRARAVVFGGIVVGQEVQRRIDWVRLI